MTKTVQESKPVTPAPNVTSLFFTMGMDMSWRLALSVLIPLIGGAELDKLWHTSPWLLVSGFIVAIVSSVITIRRTLRLSGQITIPTGKRRPVIEDDDDD